MLAWYRDLTAKERGTMWACFGGWSLDAFDVQMYSFVIPTIIGVWGLSRGEAGLIGTVTLLISSLGGWFSGTLADFHLQKFKIAIVIFVERASRRRFDCEEARKTVGHDTSVVSVNR